MYPWWAHSRFFAGPLFLLRDYAFRLVIRLQQYWKTSNSFKGNVRVIYLFNHLFFFFIRMFSSYSTQKIFLSRIAWEHAYKEHHLTTKLSHLILNKSLISIFFHWNVTISHFSRQSFTTEAHHHLYSPRSRLILHGTLTMGDSELKMYNS